MYGHAAAADAPLALPPPLPSPAPVDGEGRRPGRVRPYALTGGRTRFAAELAVESLVATLTPPGARLLPSSGGWGARLTPELSAIVELCRRMRSVAEISALLRMPLGVARVLIADLADQGRICVYGTGHGPGRPERELLERVLSGLRRL
jgi:hypothetical protein